MIKTKQVWVCRPDFDSHQSSPMSLTKPGGVCTGAGIGSSPRSALPGPRRSALAIPSYTTWPRNYWSNYSTERVTFGYVELKILPLPSILA